MNTKNKTQEKLHRCPSRAGLAQSIERLTSEREVVGLVPRAGLNSVLNKYVRGKYIDAPVKYSVSLSTITILLPLTSKFGYAYDQMRV